MRLHRSPAAAPTVSRLLLHLYVLVILWKRNAHLTAQDAPVGARLHKAQQQQQHLGRHMRPY